MDHFLKFQNYQKGGAVASGRASDPRARGWGFDPHSGRCVVSFSKIHLPPRKYL